MCRNIILVSYTGTITIISITSYKPQNSILNELIELASLIKLSSLFQAYERGLDMNHGTCTWSGLASEHFRCENMRSWQKLLTSEHHPYTCEQPILKGWPIWLLVHVPQGSMTYKGQVWNQNGLYFLIWPYLTCGSQRASQNKTMIAVSLSVLNPLQDLDITHISQELQPEYMGLYSGLVWVNKAILSDVWCIFFIQNLQSCLVNWPYMYVCLWFISEGGGGGGGHPPSHPASPPPRHKNKLNAVALGYSTKHDHQFW